MDEQPDVSRREDADIMVVDDTPANLRLLAGHLTARGYNVRAVPSGRLALASAQADPPDLVLLDINMPDMNGYEVCERLKADPRLSEIPVIFISALGEALDKVKAFSVGGVDYVTKPFQFEEVQARVETHLKIRRLKADLEEHNANLEELVMEQVDELTDAQMATILAMSALAESRDDDTGKHLERVQAYCRRLARRLGRLPEYALTIDAAFVNDICHASPLHDIGKVGIPDAVLLKPGKLTDEEFKVIQTHTTIGADTLRKVRRKYPSNSFINMGIDIAQSHHEKWNGSGCPQGLAGEDIPLCARIMALADVYDAIRSKRCYKEAIPHARCCEIISSEAGAHFDPNVASAFLEIEGDFDEVSRELSTPS